ncbi:MAG TPA: 30S ribosomal protein S6 [Desulfobacteraceae bacterium]|nr:30S ribosomal protein S6 [Desulfobacteraceae bacterium]
MRRYEQIVILDSDLSEDERSPVFGRLKELIPQYKGFLIDINEWGQKKLAYEIKKKPRGFYAQVNFCGFGDLVDEMERFFRIDDRILKYMTVLLDKEADVEAIKTEMAEKEAQKAEAVAKAAEEEKTKQAATKAAAAAAEAEAATTPEAAPEAEEAVAETAPEVEAVVEAAPEVKEKASEAAPEPEGTPVLEEEPTESAETPKE